MVEVTAPGKVLLLGGYAVLEGQPALSIALFDRRLHGVDAAAAPSPKHRLVSKQFGMDAAVDVQKPYSCISGAPKEQRVALAAMCASASVLAAEGHEARPVRIELRNSPIFGAREEKSGLGSSAAASVAVVAAMFEWSGLGIDGNRERIHRLAQLSHAIASERTGSGFDVATAAHGSMVYRRYASSFISKSLEGIGDADFGGRLSAAAAAEWPGMGIEPFRLEGYSLLVFNVKGAKTSTVSSVGAARCLAEYLPELYHTLILAQAEAEAVALEGLRKKDRKMVREGMRGARHAQSRMTDWVRRVGMLRFDPIEPPQLTEVIDEAEKADGVVAGRCPGSGGYDGLAFIIEGEEKGAEGAIMEAAGKAGIALERLEAVPSDNGVRRTDKEVI